MNGVDVPYSKIANGMPGIAARLPYLFSEGVVKGRITPEQFVALSASNTAKVFGCTTKGRIAPGMDADIAIWDPEERRTVRAADQHDNMDYSPFEGMELTGVPKLVMNRGRVIVEDDRLVATEGQGQFFGRAPVDLRGKPDYVAKEFDPTQNFGAVLR